MASLYERRMKKNSALPADPPRVVLSSKPVPAKRRYMSQGLQKPPYGTFWRKNFFSLKMLVWYGNVLKQNFKLICDGKMCITTYLIMAYQLSNIEQIYVHSM